MKRIKINWIIKYNYLMRYLNGESSIKLGEELKEQKLITTLNHKYYNGIIYR